MSRLIACLVLAGLMAGCTRSLPAAPDMVSNSNPLAASSANLLDESRQLYGFSHGICRELGSIPAPWRLVDAAYYEQMARARGAQGRFGVGYSSVPGVSIGPAVVILEAEYAALGVPPANTLPGTRHRSGRYQDVATMVIGPRQRRMAGGGDVVVDRALYGTEPDQLWPIQPKFPVSDRFEVRASGPLEYVSERSRLVIFNRELRAAVVCLPDYDVPNPRCQGLILLDEAKGEVAMINVNYEALGVLDTVVESMIATARAIRVPCPAQGAP